jgi:hypothetical protein
MHFAYVCCTVFVMIGLMKAKILMTMAIVLLVTDSKHFSSIDSCFSCQDKPPKISPKRTALGTTEFAPEIPRSN